MFWVRNRKFYIDLFLLAIPIILQSFITFGVSLADNLMIGKLGEVSISALHIGTKIQGVLQTLLFGFESALVILAAQYWGKKDTEHIKEVVSISFRLTFTITGPMAIIALFFPCQFVRLLTSDEAIVLCCADYLRIIGISYLIYGMTAILLSAMRSVEMVRIGLINSIIALTVNVGLNYLLIFGHAGFPALGVRGAAIATLTARLVELVVVAFFVYRMDPHLRLRWHDFKRWSPEILHDLIHYGTPLLAGQITWAINQFCQTVIAGHMGKVMLTSLSVVGTLEQFLCVGAFGLAAAVGITTGKTIGRGEFEQMKTQAKTMQVIFCGIGLLLSLTVFLSKDFYLHFYNLAPETLTAVHGMMTVLIVIIAFRCYQAPCLLGLVKSGGDTSFVFKNDTFFVFLIVLPSAFIAMHFFQAPPWVVYSCLLCDQVLKCFVAFIKINSFNWMKNLTRPSAC